MQLFVEWDGSMYNFGYQYEKMQPYAAKQDFLFSHQKIFYILKLVWGLCEKRRKFKLITMYKMHIYTPCLNSYVILNFGKTYNIILEIRKGI